MPVSPTPPQLEKASFSTRNGVPPGTFDVQFNPASLQYTIQNTLEENKNARQGQPAQFVTQSSAKLTMDLIFDTTHSGDDVRAQTNKMVALVKPEKDAPSGKEVPPIATFQWGAYSFTGIVEQYKETIDFFSAGGVPLRSSINLTISNHEVEFADTSEAGASVDRGLRPEPVRLPPSPDSSPQGSPASVANQLGAPRAARAIAAANNAPSLRFGNPGGLTIGAGAGVSAGAGFGIGGGIGAAAGLSAGAGASAGASFGGSAGGGVTLSPAAAFSAGASAGAGLSLGGGIGASAGAGFGASAGAGFGASAGASFGASAGAGFGAKAGAGFSAKAGASFSAVAGAGFSASAGAVAGGAFGGLRFSGPSVAPIPNPRSLIPPARTVTVGAGVQFGPGGRALSASAGASLSADVGAKAELSAGLTFGS